MPTGDREHALVVACAAGHPPHARIASLLDANQPPNWDEVWADADRHMVLPAVMTALEATVPLSYPMATRWREVSARVTRDNLAMLTQVAAILELLSTNGVPAVTWKGPALSGAGGRSLHARSSSDLDVLVCREDLPRIRQLLMAQGYRPVAVASWSPRDARREYQFEPPPNAFAMVEMQTTVGIWPLAVRLEVRDLIARSISATIAGRAIRTLSPEDNLLALAVHGATHGWPQLRYLADLDAGLRSPLDWVLVLARAQSARMRRILAIGVLLAEDVLASPVPRDVAAALRVDRAAVLMQRWLARHLRSTGTPRYRDWIGFLSRERLSDKARFATRQLFLRQVGVRADRAARRRAGVA